MRRAGRRRAGVLLLLLPLASCGARTQAAEPAPAPSTVSTGEERFAGPAVISGTAIEASTGRPLAGVEVEGPGGAKGVTDASGRFELRGLATGLTGFLRAWTAGGLEGRNRLRPLGSGRLEVVIYLR